MILHVLKQIYPWIQQEFSPPLFHPEARKRCESSSHCNSVHHSMLQSLRKVSVWYRGVILKAFKTILFNIHKRTWPQKLEHYHIMITRLTPLHCENCPPPSQVNSASDLHSFTLRGQVVLCLRRGSRMVGHPGQILLSDAWNKFMNKLLLVWLAGVKLQEKLRFELS